MAVIDKIADKLEELIKERIKDLGLVKTGKLLNSIKVSVVSDEFKVEAEDYYEVLDQEHNISGYVVESTEFQDYVAKIMEQSIDDELNKI